MPRPLDPAIRTALIDAAARLLDEHGDDGLTTRRLAAEVGTSTMAVYTHFKGMDELKLAVCIEGFERLAGFLDEVEETDDPVADVTALGSAYFINALTNSHLYRFMFGDTSFHDEPGVGDGTFLRLVQGVERAVAAGRFEDRDALMMATQCWAMAHGIVTLYLAGLLSLEEAIQASTEMAVNLFVGFGDDRDAATESIAKRIGNFLGQI